MPFLIRVRNVLRPNGMSTKLVFDEVGNKPWIDEADRRAGVESERRLTDEEVAGLVGGKVTLEGICWRRPAAEAV